MKVLNSILNTLMRRNEKSNASSLDEFQRNNPDHLVKEELGRVSGGLRTNTGLDSGNPGCYSLKQSPLKNRGNIGPIIIIEDTHFRPNKAD